MGTVFVHKYAGILSAYGMALADVVEEAQEPSAEVYEQGIIFNNKQIKSKYYISIRTCIIYLSIISRRVVRTFGRTIGRLGGKSSRKIGCPRIPRISHKNGTFPAFALSRDRLRSNVHS